MCDDVNLSILNHRFFFGNLLKLFPSMSSKIKFINLNLPLQKFKPNIKELISFNGSCIVA